MSDFISANKFKSLLMNINNLLIWESICVFMSYVIDDEQSGLVKDMLLVLVTYLILSIVCRVTTRIDMEIGLHFAIIAAEIALTVTSISKAEAMSSDVAPMFGMCFFISVFPMTIYSFIKDVNAWNKRFDIVGGKYSFSMINFVFPLIVYIHGSYKHIKSEMYIGLILIFVLILISYWCEYLQGLDDYYDVTKDIDGISKESVGGSTRKSMMIVSVIMTAVFLYSLFLKNGILMEMLGGLIVSVLKVVVVFLMRIWGSISDLLNKLIPATNYDGRRGVPEEVLEMVVEEEGISYILNYIFGMLMGVAVIGASAFAIIKSYLGGRKNKVVEEIEYEKKAYKDIVVDISDRGGDTLTGTDVRTKIRKVFRSDISKRIEGKVPENYTGTEILGKISENQKKIDETMALYDKARYSEENVTSDDLASIKKNLKDL